MISWFGEGTIAWNQMILLSREKRKGVHGHRTLTLKPSVDQPKRHHTLFFCGNVMPGDEQLAVQNLHGLQLEISRNWAPKTSQIFYYLLWLWSTVTFLVLVPPWPLGHKQKSVDIGWIPSFDAKNPPEVTLKNPQCLLVESVEIACKKKNITYDIPSGSTVCYWIWPFFGSFFFEPMEKME